MSSQGDLTAEVQRMSRLLAQVLVKDADEGEGIRMLARAGFTQQEIGDLLGITANAVKLRLLRQRRSGKK